MSDEERRSPALDRLFSVLPDPILLIDETGRLLQANRAASRLLARDATGVAGCPLASLVRDDQVHCAALIRQGLRSSVPTPGRLDLMAADGRVLPCRVEIALLEPAGEQGRATLWCRLSELRLGNSQFVVLNQQIEALKREVGRRQMAEFEMRQQSEWLDTVLQGIAEGVVATDLNGSVLFMNQVAADLTGWPRALALGRPLADIVRWEPGAAPPPQQLIRDAVVQVVRDPQQVPVDLQSRGGSVERVQVSVSVLYDESGGRSGAVMVLRSLAEEVKAESQRRSLELQLRESQKMEALGTMAGGIAHDFNNIVAAILGNTELALGDVPADSPAHVSLSEIRKAARRARSLVQQILTFARRQAQGRVALDPGEVLRETHGILRSTLPPGVQLRFSVPPQLPAVQGNATQLAQVFLNLVTNAIQAVRGREGAEVVVEATPCPGPPTAPEGGLEVMMPADRTLRPGLKVQVHDNGHGIEPAVLGRVFEPFFSTKPAGQGSGLGLSVVHGVLMEHGAALQLSSHPGAGTRFVLWLPATTEQPAAAEEAPPHPPAPHAGRHTLLYVDDDEALISLMSRMLARQGYQVESMDNPQEAIDRLREAQRRPDLVIVDYNMPQMSGISLARAIRTLDASLPIILTSGHVTDEMLADARLAGIDHVLEKPDTGRELAGLIAGLVAQHGA